MSLLKFNKLSTNDKVYCPLLTIFFYSCCLLTFKTGLFSSLTSLLFARKLCEYKFVILIKVFLYSIRYRFYLESSIAIVTDGCHSQL